MGIRNLIATVWHFMGSVKLSIVLCLLLALNLAVAYPVIKWNLITFVPLGQIDIWTWLSTYGIHNLGHTFWFFLLLGLLTLLGVNTFVCSTIRVLGLLRQKPSLGVFVLRLGPHVMHYAVIIILLGYLGSYLLSENLPGRALNGKGPPLKVRQMGGEFSYRVDSPRIYHGERLAFFDTYALDPGFVLTFKDASGKEKSERIAYSRPGSFEGWKVYLMDFYPKREGGGGMGLRYIEINFRKDKSSLIYLFGLCLFMVGIVLYGVEYYLKRIKRARVEAESS
ncbi:MAG: hypothetical protein LBE27_06520 [Deltaproteobacteria bacterium]|jgi:hypothetical protein|nr:hypothetical protein [Deltaproteobacteria bacterium]